jgi:hypothetical protein
MAEDIQVNAPLGNGERLELKLGSKSLGITMKDLGQFVVIVGAFAGFYLVSEHLSAGQVQGFAMLTKVLEQNNTHQMQLMEQDNVHFMQLLEKITTQQASLIEIVHHNRQEMTEQVARQNTLVNQQTTELRQEVDNQTKTMHHEHVLLNYNLTRDPATQMPLDVTPEELRSRRPQP